MKADSGARAETWKKGMAISQLFPESKLQSAPSNDKTPAQNPTSLWLAEPEDNFQVNHRYREERRESKTRKSQERRSPRFCA